MKRFIFGEWRDANELTLEEVDYIFEKSKSAQKISDYPMDKIDKILKEVGRRWSDSSYEKRKEAEDVLPGLTGFSPEMIALGLNELKNILCPEVLRKKIDTEFRGIPRKVGYKHNPETNTLLRWHPLGTVLHVASGNVFLVGIGSFLEGLLTGNATILKMSSDETYFMPKFVESLIEVESELNMEHTVSNSIALIDYRSSQKEIVEEFKRRVAAVVVWGGEQAVRAYRKDLPASTRLVIFGPKLSFSIVTREGMEQTSSESIADRLATEMAIWDQNACTAPQLCFVESEKCAELLVNKMGNALDKLEKQIPSGTMDSNTGAEIRKVRTVFEIAEARGEGMLRESKEGLKWTVVLDRDKTIEPSPLQRTIRIIPFEKIEDILIQVETLRSYIQTVGLVSSEREHLRISNELSKRGALKIVELGTMSGGEIDDPHDGAYDLPHLMNLVATRVSLKDGARYFDYLEESEKSEIINEKLRRVVSSARKSEFYSSRLEGIEIESIEDLIRIPILTRNEMEGSMMPKSKGLQTREHVNNGVVTRSGGSSGVPKFSWYDGDEWQSMIKSGVEMFLSCGLKTGDRVANCFMSGDLYGSFISFHDVNNALGVISFPFAGVTDPAQFVQIARGFKINVIQGVPATIVKFLKEVKKIDREFQIEKVMYAGQPMSASDRKWFKEELKVSVISSVIGTTEACQIGYQSGELEGSEHYALEDYNHVEIVDESGSAVPFGEVGRILVTSLTKHAFPLLRFDIGDAGRFVKKDGCTRVVYEYLGRSDSIISIGLMNLDYKDFARVLQKFNYSELQMVGGSEDGNECLTLNIELDERGDSVKTEITNQLLEKILELKEHLEDDLLKLEVKLHSVGSLERNKRTGKLKQIIDLRIKR